MNIALFVNFHTKPFTGYWNGKKKTFAPGQSKFMPEFLARHFAKHLANQILIENGKENYTSPKFPEQVPAFKELFDKACIPQEDDEDQEGELQDEVEMQIELANKSRRPVEKTGLENEKPHVIGGPDDDADDENADFPALSNNLPASSQPSITPQS